MRRDSIMEGLWMFWNCEYARFLHMPASQKILNMPEFDWIMSYGRVLNMSSKTFTGFWIGSGSKYAWNQNMAKLWMCKGYTGCWICLNESGYALMTSQYAWIYFNNAEYDWICQHIPEWIESWICQNSEWVWYST